MAPPSHAIRGTAKQLELRRHVISGEWKGLSAEGNAGGPFILALGHRLVAHSTGNFRPGARKLPAIPLCLCVFGDSSRVNRGRDRASSCAPIGAGRLLLD